MKMNSTDFDSPYLDLEDKELEIAFSKGLLKPGVYRRFAEVKNVSINNIQGLQKKLDEFKLNLSFKETLFLECEPAPTAPDLALQLEECKSKNDKNEGAVYNDFVREMLFYRLGQTAVLKGIPLLKKLGFVTKRPGDYLAEMAKSQEHMHKVRQKLDAKKNRIILSEKAKKLRELKKFGKKVQVQKQLDRQAEKKKILEQLKKYRKGKVNSLDFLDKEMDKTDDNGIVKSKATLKKELKKITNHRKLKDKKYGLNTGKKRGWKRNTAKDLDGPLDSSGFPVGKAPHGKPQKKRVKSNRNK